MSVNGAEVDGVTDRVLVGVAVVDIVLVGVGVFEAVFVLVGVGVGDGRGAQIKFVIAAAKSVKLLKLSTSKYEDVFAAILPERKADVAPVTPIPATIIAFLLVAL